MKRAPELRALSDDHHQGLVLARTAKKAAAGEGDLSPSAAWAEIEARFTTELEPHFAVEESVLAPSLSAHGEARLAERLREEHEALRRSLRPGAGRTPADLQRFGELLEAHIRFEERELFEVAQAKLSPPELQAVARACLARHGGEPESPR